MSFNPHSLPQYMIAHHYTMGFAHGYKTVSPTGYKLSKYKFQLTHYPITKFLFGNSLYS